MLPTIVRVASMGFGAMVGFTAGVWIGRFYGQPGDVPPTLEPSVKQKPQGSCPEDQAPRLFSKLSLDANFSPSAKDSYSKFSVEQ